MTLTGACPRCFGDLRLVAARPEPSYRCVECHCAPTRPHLRVPFRWRLRAQPRPRLIRRIRPRGSSGHLV